MDDDECNRPIEASLAHALAWGAPMWILDHDGPPPTADRRPGRVSAALQRIWARFGRGGQ